MIQTDELRQVKELFEQFGYGLGGNELIIQQVGYNWISFFETMLSIFQWGMIERKCDSDSWRDEQRKNLLTSALRWVISGDIRIEKKIGGTISKLPRKLMMFNMPKWKGSLLNWEAYQTAISRPKFR